MNKEELIQEATRRGIVPGARVHCTYVAIDITVPKEPRWDHYARALWIDNPEDAGGARSACVYNEEDDTWATVLSPAPQEGLLNGHVALCGIGMKKAIMQKARACGLPTRDSGNSLEYPHICWDEDQLSSYAEEDDGDALKAPLKAPEVVIPTWEFLRRMENTAKPVPPILIDSHTVRFEKGFVVVGCVRVPNEVVKRVYEGLRE